MALTFCTTHRSPNFEPRPQNSQIISIVLHAIGYPLAQALDTLCDPAPQANGKPHGRVSAHYLIDHNGHIYSLVDEDQKAWHAGVSCFSLPHQTFENFNDFSIGIELLNRKEDFSAPFDERQINALEALLIDIKKRHPINPALVLRHSDIAPGRKIDPGPLFPYARIKALFDTHT